MDTKSIIFPEEYDPKIAPVHVRNEIFIKAGKDQIWNWLTNAPSWPHWYANSSNIKFLNQDSDRLIHDTRFSWRTFNTNISSQVKEFEEERFIAWEAKGTGLLAYHVWIIIEEENGCSVITEETQQGWLPTLAKHFIRKGLLKQHQLWLGGLKEKAETSNSMVY